MTGLLDDIIKKLDPGKSNKINFDNTFGLNNTQNLQEDPILKTLMKSQTQATAPQQQQSQFQFQPAKPQHQQNSILNLIQQPKQTTIIEDINNLKLKLQNASLQEQQDAEKALVPIVQQLQLTIQQQLQVQQQINMSLQSSGMFYMQPALYQPKVPIQIQNVPQHQIQYPMTVSIGPQAVQPVPAQQYGPFMSDPDLSNNEIPFGGVEAWKVTRMTLEQQKKFFWIQGVDGQLKLLWSNGRDESAVGSLTLQSRIKHLLIGRPSENYVKCRLDIKHLQPIHNPDLELINRQLIEPRITIICDKRDINIVFASVEEMEPWATALRDYSGCKSIYCE